jgi:hypothetical protein
MDKKGEIECVRRNESGGHSTILFHRIEQISSPACRRLLFSRLLWLGPRRVNGRRVFPSSEWIFREEQARFASQTGCSECLSRESQHAVRSSPKQAKKNDPRRTFLEILSFVFLFIFIFISMLTSSFAFSSATKTSAVDIVLASPRLLCRFQQSPGICFLCSSHENLFLGQTV